MLDDGYALLDMGALDRLSGTAEWQRGMEIVAVIQACNAGQLSFEDAMRKREEIYSRYLRGCLKASAPQATKTLPNARWCSSVDYDNYYIPSYLRRQGEEK